ncbi:MAG: isoprenylcysteine carboxylmethyltransferase family protein [Cyclobacteriaceae bacterium]|nr:isoprenylcysteine carboxylmethyltransferase family protein [Cyclobacteriaceae bacterium]
MAVLNGILTGGLFLAYLVLWKVKSNELKRKEGVEARVLEKSTRPLQLYFGKMERRMTLAVVVIIFIHLFYKDTFSLTNYYAPMDSVTFKFIGLILGGAGLTLSRMAQVIMGKSWRVGIDYLVKPGLVTRGIFRYIRNPTYSGIFLLIIGVWLINPTFLYAYWALAFYMLIETQVRCEEEYLEEQYGEDYLEYFRSTKRYVPGVY